MPRLDITTGPTGLMLVSSSVSQSTLDAYFYTFTKAQAEARKIDSDPSSQTYFNAMIKSLSTIGWIESCVMPCCNYTSSSPPLSPLSTCANACIQFVNESQSIIHIDTAQIEGWINIACSALHNLQPEEQSQLDFWWRGTDVLIQERVMTVGTLIEIFGETFVPINYFLLDIHSDSWRSLITPSEDFRLNASSVLLTLDRIAYEQIEAKLRTELAIEIANHIKTTTLDLNNVL